MAGNLDNQLSIHQQINKLIDARNAQLKAQAGLLTGQAKLAKQMCKAMECKDLDQLEDRLKSINEELKKAAENAEEAADEMGNVGSAAGKSGGMLGGLTGKLAGLGAMTGMIGGIGSAFSGFFGVLKGAGKLIGSVVGGIFKIGKSILAIPFSLFSGLIGMAQGGGGGPSPVRLELENIRESMGSLASNEGKALASVAKTARSQFRSLNVQGVSFGRIFGYGRKGVAEAMKAMGELAKSLGTSFSGLKDTMAKNAMALTVYRKGLGLTTDQQATMLKLAKARGKDIMKEQTAFASMAINMGKQFGISAKVVAKSMGEMAADVSNFGSLSQKELAATAVYANKLGLEFKDLQGIIDKFDNFGDAAKGASQLGQAFGMQVDAMAMMKAESPAERIDMLREAFFKTGKSIEDMTRQERKLLEVQTGLAGSALDAAFGNKNMGLSYDDVMSGAEGAEKKQLSQAEAMKELSDSLKKVFGGGGQKKFKGFFDAFTKGFGAGIKRSKLFRKIMRNIRKSLKHIYRAGKAVGKAFVKFFPGVQKFGKGLQGIFDPKSFKKLGKGLVKNFTQLFKDLHTDPKGGVRTFINSMKKLFGDFFTEKMPWIEMIKEGGKKMLKTFSILIAELIPYIKAGLAKAANAMTEFIKDPSAFIDASKAAGGFIGEIFGPIIDAITEGESADNPNSVTGAFGNLFSTLWEKISGPAVEAIKKFGKMYLETAFIWVVKMAVTRALIGAGIGIILKGIAGLFSATERATPPPVPPGSGRTFWDFLTELGEMNATTIAKAGFNLVILTAFFAVAVWGMAVVMTEKIMPMFSKMDWDVLAKGLLGITATAGLTVIMAKVMENLSSVDWKKLGMATVAMAAAGGIILAVGALGAKVSEMWKGVTLSLAELGTAFAMIALLTAGMIAIAFASKALNPTMAMDMLKAMPALAAAGLLILGVGYLGAKMSNMEFDPEKMKALSIFIPSFFLTATAVAYGAIGLGMIMASGVGGLVMLAGMAALASVAIGLGELTERFVCSFEDIDIGEIKKASIAGDVAIKLVKASAIALSSAMKAGLSYALGAIIGFFTGSNPIDKGMKAMEKTLCILAKYLPKMIKDMVTAVKGANSDQIKGAVQLLEKVMKTLKPMIDAQIAAMTLADGFNTGDKGDPKRIGGMFEKMGEFVTGPVKHLTGLIDKIKDVAKDMTPQQAKAATAMAAVIASVAQFVRAMAEPMIKLIEASVETTTRMETVEGSGIVWDDVEQRTDKTFNAKALKKAMQAMATSGGAIVETMGSSAMTMINKVADNPLLEDTKKMDKVANFAKKVGPAFSAFSAMIGTMMSMWTMVLGKGANIAGGSGQQMFNVEYTKGDRSHWKNMRENRKIAGRAIKNFEGIFFGRGTTSHTGLMGILTKNLPKMVRNLNDNTKDLKPEMMEKLGKKLGVAMTAVTSIMGIMMPLLDRAGKMTKAANTRVWKTSKGGKVMEFKQFDQAAGSKWLATSIKSLAGAMGEAISVMFGAAVTILKKIPMDDAVKLKSQEGRLKQVRGIMGLFSPITDMLKAIISVYNQPTTPSDVVAAAFKIPVSFIKGSSSGAESPLVTNIRQVMNMLIGKDGKKGMLEEIVTAFTKKGGLLSKLGTPKQMKAIGKRAKLLAAVVETFTDLVKIMNSIHKSGAFKVIGTTAKGGLQTGMGEVYDGIMGMLGARGVDTGGGSKAIPSKMEALLDALNPVFKKASSMTAPKAGVFTAIGDIATALKSLFEDLPLQGKMGNLADALVTMVVPRGGDMVSPMDAIYTMMGLLYKSKRPSKEMIERLKELGPALKVFADSTEDMKFIGLDMAQIQTNVEIITTGIMSALAGKQKEINALATNVATFGGLLTGKKSFKGTKVQPFKGGKLKVVHTGQFAANVNVSVQISAKQLGEELTKISFKHAGTGAKGKLVHTKSPDKKPSAPDKKGGK